MANMNTVSIIGNLTKDMELKYTSGGMAIGNFTIAVNRDIKRDGEWTKEASFFEVAAYGKQPESLKPYLVKGKQVGIEGYLKQDRWTDQQTQQNRSKVTICANNIQLLGGKDGNNNQAAPADDNPFDNGYGAGYGN